MRNNVYTTDKEELISGYKLSAKEKKFKKDRQDKFNKQKENHGKKQDRNFHN